MSNVYTIFNDIYEGFLDYKSPIRSDIGYIGRLLRRMSIKDINNAKGHDLHLVLGAKGSQVISVGADVNGKYLSYRNHDFSDASLNVHRIPIMPFITALSLCKKSGYAAFRDILDQYYVASLSKDNYNSPGLNVDFLVWLERDMLSIEVIEEQEDYEDHFNITELGVQSLLAASLMLKDTSYNFRSDFSNRVAALEDRVNGPIPEKCDLNDYYRTYDVEQTPLRFNEVYHSNLISSALSAGSPDVQRQM